MSYEGFSVKDFLHLKSQLLPGFRLLYVAISDACYGCPVVNNLTERPNILVKQLLAFFVNDGDSGQLLAVCALYKLAIKCNKFRLLGYWLRFLEF